VALINSSAIAMETIFLLSGEKTGIMRSANLFLVLLIITVCSCSKSSNSPNLAGKWIEKSQRLDTIDFDPPFAGAYDNKQSFLLKSRPYMDITLNPAYPINPSSIFSYYTKADSMYIYNNIMSAMIYKPYSFQSTGTNSFTIGKFYLRNSLPAQLEFERLQ
jgi:hypothetical protein